MTTDHAAPANQPSTPEQRPGTEEQPTHAAARHARRRAAILSGLTIGAVVVATLVDGAPTTVASIVRGG
jgi:hypothetical protein